MARIALSERVGPVLLPSDASTYVAAAVAKTPEPLCTPGPDAEELHAMLAAGATTAAELLRRPTTDTIMPGDAALVAQLVVHAVLRRDTEIEGDAEVPLDQRALPHTGQVCVPGSLVVHGDLFVVAPLVVCGDLEVRGRIVDCGPQSVLVVLGDLECRALQTTGEVLVYGSLRARHFVWGHYNDNVLEVHGTLAAPVVMTYDHAIEAGAIEVVHRPSRAGDFGPEFFDMSPEHVRELAELVVDRSVVEDESFGRNVDALAVLAEPWKIAP